MFAIHGAAGVGQWIAFVTYAQDLPSKKGLINGLVTSMFDFSSVIYFMFNFLYFRFKFRLSIMLIAWCGWGVICFFFSFMMKPEMHEPTVENKQEFVSKLKNSLHPKNIIPLKELLTFPMITAVIVLCIQGLSSNFFMSTVLEQAQWLTGNYEKALELNNVFAVLLSIVGVITCPIFGIICDNIGIISSYVLLNFLALVWIISGLIPSVYAQYVTYTAFLSWRLFLFVMMSNWIFSTYPREVTSRLYTICLTCSGLNQLIATPLLNYIVVHYLKSYFIVNVVMGSLNFGLTTFFILMLCYLKVKRKIDFKESKVDEKMEIELLDDANCPNSEELVFEGRSSTESVESEEKKDEIKDEDKEENKEVDFIQ
jgi:hypothetical protein